LNKSKRLILIMM